MEDLTSKVLKLLREEGVEERDVRNKLTRVIEEADSRLWVKLSISLPLLYNLKDTVWYNLEHIPNNGNPKGMDNLRLMGINYPTFMFNGNDDFYIPNGVLDKLLVELEDINKQWSNEWTFVQLFTKSSNGWNGGQDDPSPVVIYDPNKGETPAKYGYQYTKSSFRIFGTNGDYIAPERQETVLCAIETKLGTYGREPMMRTQLRRLIEACKKGINNNKGIMLDTEHYDYMN